MGNNELSVKEIEELIKQTHDDIRRMKEFRAEAYKEIDGMPPSKVEKAQEIIKYFTDRAKQLNDRIKELADDRGRRLLEEKNRSKDKLISKEKDHNRDRDRELKN